MLVAVAHRCMKLTRHHMDLMTRPKRCLQSILLFMQLVMSINRSSRLSPAVHFAHKRMRPCTCSSGLAAIDCVWLLLTLLADLVHGDKPNCRSAFIFVKQTARRTLKECIQVGYYNSYHFPVLWVPVWTLDVNSCVLSIWLIVSWKIRK